MDSAGGHGGGRISLNVKTIPMLNRWVNRLKEEQKSALWVSELPFPSLQFVVQPAKSPDLNVLDLGAWNSLQVAVGEISTTGAKWTEDACNKVASTWEGWCSQRDSISSLFRLIPRIARCIVHVSGGNNYMLPHLRDKETKIIQIQ